MFLCTAHPLKSVRDCDTIYTMYLHLSTQSAERTLFGGQATHNMINNQFLCSFHLRIYFNSRIKCKIYVLIDII